MTDYRDAPSRGTVQKVSQRLAPTRQERVGSGVGVVALVVSEVIRDTSMPKLPAFDHHFLRLEAVFNTEAATKVGNGAPLGQGSDSVPKEVIRGVVIDALGFDRLEDYLVWVQFVDEVDLLHNTDNHGTRLVIEVRPCEPSSKRERAWRAHEETEILDRVWPAFIEMVRSRCQEAGVAPASEAVSDYIPW